jgi:hypothetical protein
MTVGVIFTGVGVTQAQYEQVLHQVMPNDQRPTGLRAHAAGPSADGWCVVELWESREDLDRFVQDPLRPALQAAGITVQPTIFEVVNAISA